VPAAGVEPPSLEELVTFLRAEGLSVHELPERLEGTEALPRGRTLRKMLRHELRERNGGTAGGGSATRGR